VLRWYGANTDIHDQKELEAARDQAVDDLERVTHLLSSERTNLEMQARELRRFARALKKSNEDLDRFAYVASHDLKAPLRGIANLTSWLVEDLGDKLTPETTEYASLLQNRVQRMEALIDGILQYSRAGRSREEPEQIDVGELVRDVLELIAPPSHFDVRMGDFWPRLRTERTPLQQVFMNLIGNAIKHADGDHPVIEIGLRDEGADFCEFSVSDNGPGIAAEYHERIFTIFQTLKARDEVEGTGIGLSVVKRTVENQGGQVWVESEPGHGATFSFLWPRDPDVKERTLGR
jgi:signal transduction histidine kinase